MDLSLSGKKIGAQEQGIAVPTKPLAIALRTKIRVAFVNEWFLDGASWIMKVKV
jgi:hypothetical protein